MDTFARQGLRFDVHDSGPRDGEAVLMLSGFPQTAAAWREVGAQLEAAGYRTLAPEQRGYSPGARPNGRRSYAMNELVADTLALVDSAGLQRVHVAGHDWGGAVAWTLAARHPDRVATLTALSTPHPVAFARSLRTRQGLRSWYMLLFQLPWLPERAVLRGGRRGLVRGLVRDGLPARFAEEYAERMFEPGALTAALNWYRGMSLVDMRRVPAVQVPTLYVWSSGDTYLGRAAAERSAAHVSGPYRFEVLGGVPHWIPETAADRVAPLLLEHLGAHRIGRA